MGTGFTIELRLSDDYVGHILAQGSDFGPIVQAMHEVDPESLFQLFRACTEYLEQEASYAWCPKCKRWIGDEVVGYGAGEEGGFCPCGELLVNGEGFPLVKLSEWGV